MADLTVTSLDDSFAGHPSPPQTDWRAECTRIVDGDTAVFRLDLGPWDEGLEVKVKVRLRGIDAVEMSSTTGRSAKDFLSSFMLKRWCDLRDVRRRMTDDGRGRTLASVFVWHGTWLDAAAALRENGFEKVVA